MESDYNVPRWQLRLEAIAPAGCAVMAAIALGVAGYAWAADYLAGHIQ